MKRVLPILLTLMMCLGLGACAAENPAAPAPSKDASADVAPPKEDVDSHLPPEIVESGFGTSTGSDGIYVYYGITIKNPNKDVALEFPSFRITARDESGSVIGTDDQTLSVIYPGDSETFASQAFSTDKVPSAVDFKILKPTEDHWLNVEALDHKKYVPLQVEGASRTSDSIVGEIVNSNDYDIESANVSVVFRDSDGKIIGGDSTFVDDVAASGKTPFSVYLMSGNKGKNFTAYAMPW